MKRPIALALICTAIVAPGACRERPGPEMQVAPEPSDWIMPPLIDAVAIAGGDLIFRGQAAPLGRVAVDAPAGQAYAAAVDAAGRFELRIPRPGQDTLFVVEARTGQVSYPAPYRLLVAADPAGPTALLSVGAPTRRLDPGPSLDAIDSDGRAAFLSGRALPGTAVEIGPGRVPGVRVAPDGRWSVAIPGTGSAPVRVGGIDYLRPSGAAGAEGALERLGSGWRIRWSGPGGSRQTTWFPDRQ